MAWQGCWSLLAFGRLVCRSSASRSGTLRPSNDAPPPGGTPCWPSTTNGFAARSRPRVPTSPRRRFWYRTGAPPRSRRPWRPLWNRTMAVLKRTKRAPRRRTRFSAVMPWRSIGKRITGNRTTGPTGWRASDGDASERGATTPVVVLCLTTWIVVAAILAKTATIKAVGLAARQLAPEGGTAHCSAPFAAQIFQRPQLLTGGILAARLCLPRSGDHGAWFEPGRLPAALCVLHNELGREAFGCD